MGGVLGMGYIYCNSSPTARIHWCPIYLFIYVENLPSCELIMIGQS